MQDISLLLLGVLLFSTWSSLPSLDFPFVVDENGAKHYVLMPEKSTLTNDVDNLTNVVFAKYENVWEIIRPTSSDLFSLLFMFGLIYFSIVSYKKINLRFAFKTSNHKNQVKNTTAIVDSEIQSGKIYPVLKTVRNRRLLNFSSLIFLSVFLSLFISMSSAYAIDYTITATDTPAFSDESLMFLNTAGTDKYFLDLGNDLPDVSDSTIVSQTQSATDTITPSDSTTVSQTQLATDTITPSDSTTVSQTQLATDTITPSDSSTLDIGLPATDTITPSDSTTVSQTQSTTDSPTISDSVVVIPPAQSHTDSPSISDSTAVSQTQTITDTPAASDSVLTSVNAGTVTQTVTFPSGVSGSISSIPVTVTNPTVTTGDIITFIGTIRDLTINAGSCAAGCTVSFTLTDADLAAAGISSINNVVIFQDSEEDGTFVALATTIADGAPSPYTVSATTTTTSLFGAGVSSAPTTGGGGGPSDRTAPSTLIGFRDDEFPLEVNAAKYRTYELDSIRTTTVIAGEKLSTILRVFENGGPQNVRHAEIYVNHHGNTVLNDLTETAIIYDKYSGVQILDPYDLISSGNVTVSEVGNKAEFSFEIMFAKEVPESDMLFRVWDTGANSMEFYLPKSLAVLPSQKTTIISKPSLPPTQLVPLPKDQTVEPPIQSPQETPTPPQVLPEAKPISPEEVEQPDEFTPNQLAILMKWGGFDVESADDSEVLAEFGIKGTKIPSWFKHTMKWYLSNQLKKEQFVNAMMYLKKVGLLNEEAMPETTAQTISPANSMKLRNIEKTVEEQTSKDNLYTKADIRQIENKVPKIRALANNLQLQELLISSNNEFAKNPQAQQMIEEQDIEWKRNLRNITPFMDEIMNNKGAVIAKAVIENEKDDLLPIESVLITNAYGVNVAITDLVPDYKQSDEKWWLMAKMEGVYITAGANSDQYSGLQTGEITLPIIDSQGNFIGMIKAVINLEKTLLRN